MDEMFWTLAKGNKLVGAKFLSDSVRQLILNPTGQPYIAPADFSIQSFSNNVLGGWQGLLGFRTDGIYDLQRSYNGLISQGKDGFVSDFTPVASWAFGYSGTKLGYPLVVLEAGGGLVNLVNSMKNHAIDTSGLFWNNPANTPNIEKGYSDYFSLNPYVSAAGYRTGYLGFDAGYDTPSEKYSHRVSDDSSISGFPYSDGQVGFVSYTPFQTIIPFQSSPGASQLGQRDLNSPVSDAGASYWTNFDWNGPDWQIANPSYYTMPTDASGGSDYQPSGLPFQTQIDYQSPSTNAPMGGFGLNGVDAYGGSLGDYSYTSAPFDSWSSGFGDYYDEPVIFDLSGSGIAITQSTQSNVYFDMSGNGYKSQTAWAGVGNGVLFVDLSGQGILTEKRQIVFTEWDPSALSDMQALRDVFDTNHNGKLDSGDADFSKFFVMRTNADGTQTAVSLASLGITSITLDTNAYQQSFADGSSIDGETTFTYANGTTGTAATTSLAHDATGHVVSTTTTVNSDGSTTIANAARASDGSLDYTQLLNTSANGLSKVLSRVNTGGVVTALQTDVTTVSGTTKTEVVTNYANGVVQANGALTASGVSGDEKLNSTTTTVSGGVTTILRDQKGGGWTTQKEVDAPSTTGPSTITVSQLNPDGSASDVKTTTVSLDGLTRTVVDLVDGVAANSVKTVDTTIVGAASGSTPGTRTETLVKTVGTTTTGKTVTATQTSGSTVTRTVTSDLMNGTTVNLVSTQTTTTNADGSTTTTIIDKSASGVLIDESVTTVSASGLLKTTKYDTTGVTSAGSPVFDRTVADNTVVNADASRTETVTTTSQNGNLQSQMITQRAATGPGRTITTYGDGSGKATQTETIVAAATGAVTDTLTHLNADGSYKNQTVSVTSADGLSVTTQTNTTGAQSNGTSVFDHSRTDVTVHNADGSSTETVSDYGASTSALIDRRQTVISGNGLSRTTSIDFTGANFTADGTWDRVVTDVTTANADNSLSETATTKSASGAVLSTVITATSADRRFVTTTTTLGTANLVKTVETVTTQSNGAVVDSSVRFDKNGDVLGATTTTTSADGLSKITQTQAHTKTAAAYGSSSLSYDLTTSDVVVINADGSRTETANATAPNGALLSTAKTTTSANGYVATTQVNPYASVHFAKQTVVSTTINSDASTTSTTTDTSYSGAKIDQTTVTKSASGLSTTTLRDLNGDGTTDQSTTDTTIVNADGSRTETLTDYTGGVSGTVRDVTTTTTGIIVTGVGQKAVVTRQSNGSVPTYQVETTAPSASGTTSDVTQYYATAGGALLKQTATTVSGNGLVKSSYTAVNGDTSYDFWTIDTTTPNADGSRTETVTTSNKAGLISQTQVATSADGLSTTTSFDADGTMAAGAAVYKKVTTDRTVLNADGSNTETVSVANQAGGVTTKTQTTTSADQQTVSINRFLNETGSIATVDQTETIQTQADGSRLDTTTSYDAAHALLGTIAATISGDGLSKTTVYKTAAGVTTDTQSDVTTYDANGDGGRLEDFEQTLIFNGATFTNSTKTQTSGSGQTATTAMVLAGALSSAAGSGFSTSATTSTSIADTGVTTQTTAVMTAGAAADTKAVTTSANGLSKTTTLAFAGAASAFRVQQDVTNLDGSKTSATTTYDPAALSTVLDSRTQTTSADGRTVTVTRQSDYDQLNNNGVVFGGPVYNTETAVYTLNADGTTRETRAGSGSFGAPVYTQLVTQGINADASQTTTIVNSDGSTDIRDQSVGRISANGLVKGFAYDTTGQESTATLVNAAAALVGGTTLPGGMRPSDIIGLDQTTLNSDGGTTELVETGYGGSFSNLRSKTTRTTSANGLIVTTAVDNDGNGVTEQTSTLITSPDGSKTQTFSYYGDTAATASTLIGTNTTVTSADGLTSTMTVTGSSSGSGITDTTIHFADANGSYEWARSVIAGSNAANFGWAAGGSSHMIDANGIDTWSWNDGYGTAATNDIGSIKIDIATEKKDIAISDALFKVLLGHGMDDSEREYCGQYIKDGVFNRQQQALDLINSEEFFENFTVYEPGTATETYQDGHLQ